VLARPVGAAKPPRLDAQARKKMGNKSGFTLIELLTVILIIGLLAVIALPKFVNTRARAHYAAMQSDLRNLATVEENYYAQNKTYTPNLSQLQFNPSENVAVAIGEATDIGWIATATFPGADPLQCELFYGTVSGTTLATKEGVIACDN